MYAESRSREPLADALLSLQCIVQNVDGATKGMVVL